MGSVGQTWIFYQIFQPMEANISILKEIINKIIFFEFVALNEILATFKIADQNKKNHSKKVISQIANETVTIRSYIVSLVTNYLTLCYYFLLIRIMCRWHILLLICRGCYERVNNWFHCTRLLRLGLNLSIFWYKSTHASFNMIHCALLIRIN